MLRYCTYGAENNIKLEFKMETIHKQLVNKFSESPTEGGEGVAESEISKKRTQKKQPSKILTPEQKAKRINFKKTLMWLCETFPECFSLSAPKPLKRHIDADIFLHLSTDNAPSKRSIRTVLAFYTKQKKYHKALLDNPQRFNLEGFVGEEVQLLHKEYAKTVLEERKSKRAFLKQENKES